LHIFQHGRIGNKHCTLQVLIFKTYRNRLSIINRLSRILNLSYSTTNVLFVQFMLMHFMLAAGEYCYYGVKRSSGLANLLLFLTCMLNSVITRIYHFCKIFAVSRLHFWCWASENKFRLYCFFDFGRLCLSFIKTADNEKNYFIKEIKHQYFYNLLRIFYFVYTFQLSKIPHTSFDVVSPNLNR